MLVLRENLAKGARAASRDTMAMLAVVEAFHQTGRLSVTTAICSLLSALVVG